MLQIYRPTLISLLGHLFLGSLGISKDLVQALPSVCALQP